MVNKYLELKVGRLFYTFSGQGKTIVFLHGWGQNFSTFSRLIPHLENNFSILGIDLFGFGMSDEPLFPLSLDDYVESVKLLFQELKIENPILIGHSFGGRIAIRYAARNPLSGLILISSAGIRKRSLKRFLKVRAYKIKRLILRIISKEKYNDLVKKSGSADFLNASVVMKRTMSKVIGQHLQKDLKKIKLKTFLLWGIYDQETPYKDAELMAKLLSDSELIPFYKSTHFCYLEEEQRFIKIMKKILLEDKYGKVFVRN
jgi:pimeloyl-ACP methyl ester carboxylesterase